MKLTRAQLRRMIIEAHEFDDKIRALFAAGEINSAVSLGEMTPEVDLLSIAEDAWVETHNELSSARDKIDHYRRTNRRELLDELLDQEYILETRLKELQRLVFRLSGLSWK